MCTGESGARSRRAATAHGLPVGAVVAVVAVIVCALAAGGGGGARAQPGDHDALAAGDLFPYAVAVLKMSSYVGAGAVIHEDWVLTAADGLYLVRESVRLLRVRLGSVNYKRGGTLLPVKYVRIHPYFDDSRPEYDVALMRLPRAAGSVRPVRLQKRPRLVTATHFLVTAWTPYYTHHLRKSRTFPDSMEMIKRSRILTAKQLHPLEGERCRRLGAALAFSSAHSVMCLEPPPAADPCKREAGAPVVLNGVLWGVVSSWRSDSCRTDGGPIFVNLVAAPNISSWIDAVMQDLHWMLKEINVDEDNYI